MLKPTYRIHRRIVEQELASRELVRGKHHHSFVNLSALRIMKRFCREAKPAEQLLNLVQALKLIAIVQFIEEVYINHADNSLNLSELHDVPRVVAGAAEIDILGILGLVACLSFF